MPMTDATVLVSGLIVFAVIANEFLKKVSPPKKRCSRCGRPLKS